MRRPRLPELSPLKADSAIRSKLSQNPVRSVAAPVKSAAAVRWRSRPGRGSLSAARLVCSLSVLPAATYIAVQFPDWSLMYLSIRSGCAPVAAIGGRAPHRRQG